MDYKNELEYFKSISSIEDYEIVIKDDVNINEYVRMEYLLDTLELYELSIQFFQKHYSKFEDVIESMNKVEEIELMYDECEIYMADTREEWLKDFILNIKDTKTREEIMDKVKIGY